MKKTAVVLAALALAASLALSACSSSSVTYTDAQKLAIRQAMASMIDRDALSNDVYKTQYTPLCSYVPDGFVGATSAVCDMYPLDK